MSQEDLNFNETIDYRGRKALALGLHSNHEPLVDILDAAVYFHGSMERYTHGIVTAEMKRLGAGERAAVLDRLTNDLLTAHESLGAILKSYHPTNEAMNSFVRLQVEMERKAAEQAKLSSQIDEQFKVAFPTEKAEEPQAPTTEASSAPEPPKRGRPRKVQPEPEPIAEPTIEPPTDEDFNKFLSGPMPPPDFDSFGDEGMVGK